MDYSSQLLFTIDGNLHQILDTGRVGDSNRAFQALEFSDVKVTAEDTAVDKTS